MNFQHSKISETIILHSNLLIYILNIKGSGQMNTGNMQEDFKSVSSVTNQQECHYSNKNSDQDETYSIQSEQSNGNASAGSSSGFHNFDSVSIQTNVFFGLRFENFTPSKHSKDEEPMNILQFEQTGTNSDVFKTIEAFKEFQNLILEELTNDSDDGEGLKFFDFIRSAIAGQGLIFLANKSKNFQIFSMKFTVDFNLTDMVSKLENYVINPWSNNICKAEGKVKENSESYRVLSKNVDILKKLRRIGDIRRNELLNIEYLLKHGILDNKFIYSFTIFKALFRFANEQIKLNSDSTIYYVFIKTDASYHENMGVLNSQAIKTSIDI